MKPSRFEYVGAESLEHAIALLAEDPDGSKLIAGGQSLLPLMRFRLTSLDRLIDISRLTELAGVTAGGDVLRVGAATRQAALERHPLVRAHAPLVSEALPWIAHAAIRNRGTFGGSLAHADRSAELPAVLLALGGAITATSARGARRLAAEDLFVSDYVTALAEDEVLTSIELPMAAEDEASVILEVSRRPGDFALAGVAVRVRGTAEVCEEARCVAFGVGPIPVRLETVEGSLVRGGLTQDEIVEAVDRIPEQLDPASDVHASADYRREAATALARRALILAGERLRARCGSGAPR